MKDHLQTASMEQPGHMVGRERNVKLTQILQLFWRASTVWSSKKGCKVVASASTCWTM
jgi:hypothetical protein